jgi:hypothetical protein
MPNSNYHKLQAGLLIRLAETTTDAATARRLLTLAADHVTLADHYAAGSTHAPAVAAGEKP